MSNPENNPLFSEHSLVLKNIITNLIVSLTGLSYSYKLKGYTSKEISYLEESVELSERYNLIEYEIKLKNKLALAYLFYNQSNNFLDLIKFNVKHPQINKEQFIDAKILMAKYYYYKGNFKIAENILLKILKEIGEQHSELRLHALLDLALIKIVSPDLNEAIHLLNKADKCAKNNNIDEYDIRLNDHFAQYYLKILNFSFNL